MVENALSAGESFAVEARFQRPDGDLRWAEVRGDSHIEDGEVVTLRGAVHDITDRKQRERALREIHAITSNQHNSFEDQVQSVLELGRRELDTEYGTLSKIRGENDSRHRKYALLLVVQEELPDDDLQDSASYYDIEDIVMKLVEFLRTEGETVSDTTPRWEEFETLASEYEVDL